MKVMIITPEKKMPATFVGICLDMWHAEHGITRVSYAHRTSTDMYVKKWCKMHGIPQIRWDQFWNEHPHEDMYVRDLQMIRWDQPDYVFGFPGFEDPDERVLAALQTARRYDFPTKTFDESHVYDLSVLQGYGFRGEGADVGEPDHLPPLRSDSRRLY